jgi:hypothetical protein
VEISAIWLAFRLLEIRRAWIETSEAYQDWQRRAGRVQASSGAKCPRKPKGRWLWGCCSMLNHAMGESRPRIPLELVNFCSLEDSPAKESCDSVNIENEIERLWSYYGCVVGALDM